MHMRVPCSTHTALTSHPAFAAHMLFWSIALQLPQRKKNPVSHATDTEKRSDVLVFWAASFATHVTTVTPTGKLVTPLETATAAPLAPSGAVQAIAMLCGGVTLSVALMEGKATVDEPLPARAVPETVPVPSIVRAGASLSEERIARGRAGAA
jgi:hypothetical protein